MPRDENYSSQAALDKFRLDRDRGLVDNKKKERSTAWWDRLNGRDAEEHTPFDSSSQLSFLNKRPEVIEPYLGAWDRTTLKELLIKAGKKAGIEQIRARNGKEYSYNDFIERNASAIYDLYNLYNVKSEDISFVKETDRNKNRFKLLFNSNNANMKILTNNHSLYSYIMTSHITQTMFEVMADEEDKSGNGGGILSDDGMSEFGSQNQHLQKQIVEDAVKQADKQIEDIDDAGGAAAGKGGALHEIERDLKFLDFLKKVNVNPHILLRLAKQVGSMTSRYFSKNQKNYEEPILEADEILELDGLENLLYPLNKLGYQDLTTYRTEYKVGFDAYIDYSGSMSGNTQLADGSSIGRLDLCKICALKLMHYGLVEKTHFFDTSLVLDVSEDKLLSIRPNGGTDIELVIQDVINKGTSALILTDLGDSIYTYSPNVFFISFCGYGGFTYSEAGKQYLANGQCVRFDGEIFEIDKTGEGGDYY